MSSKQTSTERSTLTPEQQRAEEAAAKKHPGRNPPPDDENVGVQPDKLRERVQNELQKTTAEGP